MIYKLQLLTYDDDEVESWKDFYLDVTAIKGFYIPTVKDSEEPSINLLISDGFYSVKQEELIKDYLYNTFHKPSKKVA